MTELERAIAAIKVITTAFGPIKKDDLGCPPEVGIAISAILNAAANDRLVPAPTVEQRKFYLKDWTLTELLKANDGKLLTDDGEAWRYEYTHTDGTGGEYHLCWRHVVNFPAALPAAPAPEVAE